MDGDSAEDYLEWCQTHGTDPSDESAEFYVEPVSYTHLDVYKRQGKSNVQLVVGEFPAFGDSQTRTIGTPDPGKTSWRCV